MFVTYQSNSSAAVETTNSSPIFNDVMQLIASTSLINGADDKHTNLQIPIFSESNLCSIYTRQGCSYEIEKMTHSTLFLLVHIFSNTYLLIPEIVYCPYFMLDNSSGMGIWAAAAARSRPCDAVRRPATSASVGAQAFPCSSGN
jgi:hypothetical protein